MQAMIEVYKLSELEEKAKQKALEWLSEGETNDSWWYESVYDLWKSEKLPEVGITDAEINFSGFWSQGDGASFAGTIEIPKFLAGRNVASVFKRYRRLVAIEAVADRVAITRVDSRYSHPNSITVDEIEDLSGNFRACNLANKDYAELEDLRKFLLAEVRDLCREVYRDLEEEYIYRTSEESLTEVAEINQFLFDKYGNPVHHLIVVQATPENVASHV